MDLVNLAYNGHASPTEMSFVPALFPVLFIVVVIGLPIYAVMSARRARQGPKFDGPALTGTAQVLSVQPTISTANWGLMVSGGAMCRIGLIVEIPGYPPYDVTVTTPVPSATLYTLHGRTVAVQVDSANLQKVRVDPNQPTPQAGSVGWAGPAPEGMSYGAQPPFNAPQPLPGSPYSMSPGMRMYIRVMWGIVAVGFIAAVVVLIVLAINDPALVFHTILEKLFHGG